MNSMHDSHKRTSISQLLNPSSDSSGYSHVTHLPSLTSSAGVPQYQHPQHPPPHGPYSQQPESGSSFHLRAASWEPVNDDQVAPKRRPDAGPNVARPYPMPPQMYAEMNGDMPQRQQRPRIDEHGNYAIAANPWPTQPEVPNVPYGSPVMAPMYSDERTGQPVFEVGPLMHPPPGMFPPCCTNIRHHHLKTQKRSSTEIEEPTSQKSKKAKKAKPADGNASSKRGYNAELGQVPKLMLAGMARRELLRVTILSKRQSLFASPCYV
ncbi:hypothetical protein BU15DRAFT_69720 [Melanogaster broomeanus]|nr:hypothetical protein BU15DRAFT_69720 [Melanogaster broomeanus]